MMRARAVLSQVESRGTLSVRRKPIGQGTSVKNHFEPSIAVAALRSGRSADGVDDGGRDQARRGPGLRRGGPLHPRRDAAVQRVRPRRRPYRGLPQGQAEAAHAGVRGARCRAAAARKRPRSTAHSVTKPDPPAFAQRQSQSGAAAGVPWQAGRRHGTVVTGGLCSRRQRSKTAMRQPFGFAMLFAGAAFAATADGRRHRASAPIAATTRCSASAPMRSRAARRWT